MRISPIMIGGAASTDALRLDRMRGRRQLVFGVGPHIYADGDAGRIEQPQPEMREGPHPEVRLVAMAAASVSGTVLRA